MKKIVLLAAMMAVPFSVSASNFNYSNIEVSYAQTHFDDELFISASDGLYLADKLSGLNLNASWQFHENVFLRAEGSYQGVKSGSGSVELTSSNYFLTLGGTYPVGEKLDLGVLVSAGNVQANIEIDGTENKADSNASKIGVFARMQLTPILEVNLDFNKVNYSQNNIESDTIIGAGLAFNINDKSAIITQYRSADDAAEYSIGYRLNFR
jgi:hypothetical protein